MIQILDRFFPAPEQTRQRERLKLVAMMALYFLVLFAVGILRPIRNALALDGLAETKFYQVYLVSGVVILAVPPYNRLADRVRWRVLIPGVAAFFAVTLLVLRLLYSDGSTAFGMVFYGYYDLFAAALVTQFFMAVQVFFNARDAKSAIPLVIIGGSLGATFGGFTTGLLSKTLGAPNLMLVAAFFIALFAAALPFVWAGYPPIKPPGRTAGPKRLSAGEFTRIFSHRHIRLIAALVLITVLVKTMVDYEFNEITALYAGERDAISSFQGWVLGATQWLPILVLLVLGPILKRWGVGTAVLILPVVMLLTSVGLALVFGVWMAVAAKASDTTFRYSAERTAREVLYVPVPTDLKLRAKTYIDMAVEKGVGKVFSAVVIFLLLQMMGLAGIPWVIAAFSVVWILGALAVRREYLATLSESIRGRFASLRGSFATLTERSTLAFVEEALRGDPVQVAFALDLVEQAGRVDAEPLADEMEMLLDHGSSELRARVLHLLARFPGLVPTERIEERLSDGSRSVREAAVVALAAASDRPEDREQALRGLLASADPRVRHATLATLLRGDVECDRRAVVGREYVEERMAASAEAEGGAVAATGGREGDGGETAAGVPGSPEAREELAMALGLLDGEAGGPPELLEKLLEDPEPRVARAALMAAGVLRRADLRPAMLAHLADPALREEARRGLAAQGADVVELLEAWLTDPHRDRSVRRQIPGVMARIPTQVTVSALLRALREPGPDRVVEFRTLKALNKLRSGTASEEPLEFDPSAVLAVARREVEEADRYAVLRAGLARSAAGGSGIALLRQSLEEAWEEGREAVFRCLGLVFPPDEIYRAYLTITHGDERSRANAVEWLDETVGHDLFVRVEPVLSRPDGRGKPPLGGWPGLDATLEELGSGRNEWLSRLAAWNLEAARAPDSDDGSVTMDRIEKVFLLQKVDLLEEAKSSHLALLASIAEEVEVAEGEVLIRQGQTNESLYVVIRGSVELRGMGDQLLVAGENAPFGTWALIDSDPSVVGATAAEPSRLLRITRGDFEELLADHPELAMGMLQGLARRLRALVV